MENLKEIIKQAILDSDKALKDAADSGFAIELCRKANDLHDELRDIYMLLDLKYGDHYDR